jgi:hypothetical protein
MSLGKFHQPLSQMNPAQSIWQLIASGDPQTWGAIFGGLASALIGVIGAIIGAAIGARASRRAAIEGADKAFAHGLSLASKTRTIQAVATVIALLVELDTFVSNVTREYGQLLTDAKKEHDSAGVFPSIQQRFPVYDASLQTLALIDDRALQRSLIRAYLSAIAFLDTLRHRNTIHEEQSAKIEADPSMMEVNRMVAHRIYDAFAVGVWRHWQDFEARWQDVLAASNAWLAEKGEKPYATTQVIGV